MGSGSIQSTGGSSFPPDPQVHNLTSANRDFPSQPPAVPWGFSGRHLSLCSGTKMILGCQFYFIRFFCGQALPFSCLVPLVTQPECSQLSSGPLFSKTWSPNAELPLAVLPPSWNIWNIAELVVKPGFNAVGAVALIAITPNKPPLKNESLLTSTHLETSPSCCTSDLSPDN